MSENAINTITNTLSDRVKFLSLAMVIKLFLCLFSWIKVNGEDFIVRGVCYSPVPIGENVNTSPFGDYFTKQYRDIWARDLPLIKKVNNNNKKLINKKIYFVLRYVFLFYIKHGDFVRWVRMLSGYMDGIAKLTTKSFLTQFTTLASKCAFSLSLFLSFSLSVFLFLPMFLLFFFITPLTFFISIYFRSWLLFLLELQKCIQ